MKDVLGVPESFFMLYDTIVAFDHFFQVVKVITYVPIPSADADIEASYLKGQSIIQKTIEKLLQDRTPLPPQGPIIPNQEYTSNIGQEGYEGHVNRLKEHIAKGDIFQIGRAHV